VHGNTNLQVARFAILKSLLVLNMIACAQQYVEIKPIPKNMPAEAILVGGEKGGDWMACSSEEVGVLSCQRYRLGSSAYWESWFRYCPNLGVAEAGRPDLYNGESGLIVSDVQLRRDRPDKYHPDPNETSESVALELEIIDKDYFLDGVDKDCNALKSETKSRKIGKF
jgi:hypothetical protein